MKLKIALLCALLVSLIGCADKNPKSAQIDRNLHEIKSKPDYERAALLNIELGQKYLAQGQPSRAKKKFVHALELKPKMPEAHSAIAYFYETVGDIEEAESHHRQAIKFGGDKGRFYNNYGTYLCRQKRFKEADRAFNNALKDKQYTKTAEVYENAGTCVLQQPEADFAKASEYLLAAIQHDPNRATASLELANIELQKQNLQAALHYLNMYKNISQPTPKSLWIGIQTYKKLNKKDELASAILQLRSLYPESAEYKKLLESYKHE